MGTKNFRHVALPETLDMLPYVGRRPLGQAAETALAAAGGRLEYRLASIVVHAGHSLRSGHYVAYKRASPGGAGAAPAWECWDDRSITPLTWEVVAAQPAYLVFYECTNMGLLAAVFP